MTDIQQIPLKTIKGADASLADYAGKVVLAVNVASKCGLTPQYEGLEKLYAEYKDKGLVVAGFPANDFGAQEPGDNDEIATFCTTNFGVEFPMFEKIVVKGEGQHPLYHYLTTTKPSATMKEGGTLITRLKDKGLISGKENDIHWNFEKFLVNKKGEVVDRFSPELDPMDPVIVKAVERELANA